MNLHGIKKKIKKLHWKRKRSHFAGERKMIEKVIDKWLKTLKNKRKGK